MTDIFSIDYARQLDQQDPISRMREQFHIPKQDNGDDEIYLCGNSLEIGRAHV